MLSYKIVINKINTIKKIQILNQMITVDPDVPLKQTHNYLASFPRFSLIEKIQPKFFQSSFEASKKVAQEIKEAIRAKAYRTNDPFILGLVGGRTVISIYKEIINIVKKGQLSFKNVVTFNLDQYYPIKKNNVESYNYFMKQNLFDHIDIPPQNINIPDGQIQRGKVSKFCDEYERKIRNYGGIDLQILGISRSGNIGFNQPPLPAHSLTRLVYLNSMSRKDAINNFHGIQNVPRCAITMGVETISKAKKIIIMAWGEQKAAVVKKSIQGPSTPEVPSTFLHNHPDAIFYLDNFAGQQLSRFKIPWTIKGDQEDPVVPYTKYWIKKMIFWLSKEVKKPIQRLSFQDYQDHGLSPIVMNVARGNVEDLNFFVYRRLHQKITQWPLGDKPNQLKDDQVLKTSVRKQKVLVFSPHPDDDVISMGGTINRLKNQGHYVIVAYMTTGSNSVHDYQTMKYIHMMKDFIKYVNKLKQNKYPHQNGIQPLNSEVSQITQLLDSTEQSLRRKKIDQKLVDIDTVKLLKGLIRSSQAKISVQTFGIMPKDVHCMELPFYTHHAKKKEICQEDRECIRKLLREVKPTYIYAAGDLGDPHGTHRKCLETILQVQSEELQKCKKDPKYKSLFPPPEKIFFYKGAWEEWDLAMCRVIVPMTPSQVEQKQTSILKHQSQKDSPMFPGNDKRQFWMRSKERNRNTAAQLRDLGFSDYQAAQCFINLSDLINYESF